MYVCPQCQKPFESGVKFCESCGNNLAESFIIEPICPKCKRTFSAGTRFCLDDGSILTTKDKLIPKCISCGAEYSEGTKFCPKEGSPVIAEAYRSDSSLSQSNRLNTSTQYGGFWDRVGAWLIDNAVLLVPILLVDLLQRFTLSQYYYWYSDEGMRTIDFFLNVMVGWAYFATLHSSSWQATVGKRVIGLKVVDEHGSRLSFGRATGRFFAAFLSGLILGIGFMMVGWTEKKQGLHDMIAKTFVIKK